MTEDTKRPASGSSSEPEKKPEPAKKMPKEINGPKGPEPTRYGDWERNGIASDF
jgi:hypothetical protein